MHKWNAYINTEFKQVDWLNGSAQPKTIFLLDLQNVGEFLSCIRTVINIFGSLANISYMYQYTV